MYPINSEDDNLAEVAEDLGSRLRRFNEAAAGPLRTHHVALTVRDHTGLVVAGLTGETFWNAMHVHLLWVDEGYRGLGYGTLLLRRAEALAIQRSCGLAYLSTFDFQAPAFYVRHGYSVFGELRDVPAGSGRQWLCKSLGAAASDAQGGRSHGSDRQFR